MTNRFACQKPLRKLLNPLNYGKVYRATFNGMPCVCLLLANECNDVIQIFRAVQRLRSTLLKKYDKYMSFDSPPDERPYSRKIYEKMITQAFYMLQPVKHVRHRVRV